DVELSATSHAAFSLRFRHRGKRQPAFWNHQCAVQTDVLKDFEVYGIANMSIGGRDGAVDPQLYRRAVFQYESLRRSKVRWFIRRGRWRLRRLCVGRMVCSL